MGRETAAPSRAAERCVAVRKKDLPGTGVQGGSRIGPDGNSQGSRRHQRLHHQDAGTRYMPEFACLPTINVNNILIIIGSFFFQAQRTEISQHLYHQSLTTLKLLVALHLLKGVVIATCIARSERGGPRA